MKFVVFSLTGLIQWFIIIIGFIGGGDNTVFDFSGYHPRLKALYGVVELGTMITSFILFKIFLHVWWKALLITIGIYLAYLVVGTIIELCYKMVKCVLQRKKTNAN